MGFKSTTADASVFISEDKQIIICVYVDDLLLFGVNDNFLKKIRLKLSNRFKMTDLGPVAHYLGMSITRSKGRISLNQKSYLLGVLERFGMSNCNSMDTSMETGVPNVMMPPIDDYKADVEIVQWYALVIGSLMYAMTMTRPDLGFALSVLSRYCANPDSIYVKAAIRVLKYVKGTLDYSIHYSGSGELLGYSDADYAGAVDGRRFIGGWLYMLVGGPISWSARRQDLVTQSSCESEYVVMAEAGKEAVWIRSLLLDLQAIPKGPIIIYADNQGAISLAENFSDHRRTKHIDTKYHWIREAI